MFYGEKKQIKSSPSLSQYGIKPGSNSKKTDKHAADCSKAVCWGVKIYVRCINCSYNNVAKHICLLDKKKQFLFIQEKFYASKSF